MSRAACTSAFSVGPTGNTQWFCNLQCLTDPFMQHIGQLSSMPGHLVHACRSTSWSSFQQLTNFVSCFHGLDGGVFDKLQAKSQQLQLSQLQGKTYAFLWGNKDKLKVLRLIGVHGHIVQMAWHKNSAVRRAKLHRHKATSKMHLLVSVLWLAGKSGQAEGAPRSSAVSRRQGCSE